MSLSWWSQIGTLVSIVYTGPVIWLVMLLLAVFFAFLHKGGLMSRMAGLVFSVISWMTSITPQYIVYSYDNLTQVYTSQYIVPQAGQTVNGVADGGWWYYALFAWGFFLIALSAVRIIAVVVEKDIRE